MSNFQREINDGDAFEIKSVSLSYSGDYVVAESLEKVGGYRVSVVARTSTAYAGYLLRASTGESVMQIRGDAPRLVLDTRNFSWRVVGARVHVATRGAAERYVGSGVAAQASAETEGFTAGLTLPEPKPKSEPKPKPKPKPELKPEEYREHLWRELDKLVAEPKPEPEPEPMHTLEEVETSARIALVALLSGAAGPFEVLGRGWIGQRPTGVVVAKDFESCAAFIVAPGRGRRVKVMDLSAAKILALLEALD